MRKSVRLQRVRGGQRSAGRVHRHRDRGRVVRHLSRRARVVGRCWSGRVHETVVLRRVRHRRQPENVHRGLERRPGAQPVRRCRSAGTPQARQLRPLVRPGNVSLVPSHVHRHGPAMDNDPRDRRRRPGPEERHQLLVSGRGGHVRPVLLRVLRRRRSDGRALHVRAGRVRLVSDRYAAADGHPIRNRVGRLRTLGLEKRKRTW